MVNTLNKIFLRFPWELSVFFIEKTGKLQLTPLVLWHCILFFPNLKSLKSFCGKRDAFDCAGTRARVFRLLVDFSNGNEKMWCLNKIIIMIQSFLFHCNFTGLTKKWRNEKKKCRQKESNPRRRDFQSGHLPLRYCAVFGCTRTKFRDTPNVRHTIFKNSFLRNEGSL